MDLGIIGLGVMGRNLALNAESRGYSVAVYNRTGEKTDEFIKNQAQGKKITPAYNIGELAGLLHPPRKIMLMVKSGAPVDKTIESLLPCLDPGDLIIDGGNSHFADTRRRSQELSSRGILFLGTGVSGGEEGALKGPCLMPGGQREAYELVEKIFADMAAKVEDFACCAYMGPGEAGHYVKMVHNGIEYGDMQLIAEAYDYLRRGLDLSVEQVGDIFARWKTGPLSSYLMDITVDILKVTDEETGRPLISMILDRAGQKGTGKWTSQAAMDMGIPVTIIDTAVSARYLSAMKSQRVVASRLLPGPGESFEGDIDEAVRQAHDALLCSRISVYTQGMSMLGEASRQLGLELNLSKIAGIWRGGCIIRAEILESISEAFEKNKDLSSLYLDINFAETLSNLHKSWRSRVIQSVRLGIPCPATGAALAYYDSIRSSQLPTSLIQAQRDYFGAHTYERIDREGVFHTNWSEAPIQR